jgi:predicted regulator of Ras-like GTPase activity (Roadblock/LC7/MglB family)
MASPSMVVMEADHTRFMSILDNLRSEANSRFAFLMDKNGQSIASSGVVGETDHSALASLAAGNVAATEGLAALIGEDEFSTLFHEGRHDSLHISLIANKVILLVIFDEHSSLGLVKLRVQQRLTDLESAVREMMANTEDPSSNAPIPQAALAEITDDDIEALFG